LLVKNLVILALLAVAVPLSSGCGGRVSTGPTDARPIAVGPEEHQRTIDALRPPKRERPLIAVLADNAGTETTDFLVPYGVLVASEVADVVAVAPESGPIELMPALRVAPQQTLESFDEQHPTGADYVVVPALHRTDVPILHDWIRSQAEGGATIVAICSGALVLAEAGLLEGRAATTHWFDIDSLERSHPTLRRVDDRRYVADRGIATTTGVTASVPISLAIIEAIAGKQRAAAVAERLGAPANWTATHDSDAFRLDGRSITLAIRNLLAFWAHEDIGVRVQTGVDEIALAFTADAYSRTYRSRAFAVAEASDPIVTRRGLTLLPDRVADETDFDFSVRLSEEAPPVESLDLALAGIEHRYGEGVAAFVALQLEYDDR